MRLDLDADRPCAGQQVGEHRGAPEPGADVDEDVVRADLRVLDRPEQGVDRARQVGHAPGRQLGAVVREAVDPEDAIEPALAVLDRHRPEGPSEDLVRRLAAREERARRRRIGPHG
ncbi:MAG: hypothetical protein H6711_29330 [Myxococcales bacterium]|nr:hypothetical protein [Myxococcales bacterium]